jgi:hypothetical protein
MACSSLGGVKVVAIIFVGNAVDMETITSPPHLETAVV